jgi:hypothetical protein
MSGKITSTLYALWYVQPVLASAVAIVMFRRGQHRVFKYFFTYIVTQVLTFLVDYPTYRYNHSAYFYVSELGTAVSVALGFMVIYEAFLDVFRPFHTLRDLGRVLFKWAGLVMLLVAGVVSVSSKSPDTAVWVDAILTAQRCVRIVQVGMVLFLLIFARYLGVSRRQRSFGIALGFGAFAIVELGLVALLAGYQISSLVLSVVNVGAYDAVVVIWFGYMLAESPARDIPASLLKSQRWEQGLSDIQHPLPADSLIPMFEDMVDRALSRTPVSSGAVGESHGLTSAPIPQNGPRLSSLSAKAGSKSID